MFRCSGVFRGVPVFLVLVHAQISRLSKHFLAFEGILSKDLGIERFFLSKDTNVFCKPLLGPDKAFHHRPMMADTGASLQYLNSGACFPCFSKLTKLFGPNFFQVPQFPLYLRDAEVLSHQASPSFAYKTTTTQFTSNGERRSFTLKNAEQRRVSCSVSTH